MLLPGNVDHIPKEQSRKKDALGIYSIDYIKMVYTLWRKVVALYLGAFVVQVGPSDLKAFIPVC